MAPRARTESLAPRILLLFAVLVCLLGLGQGGASAAQPAPMPAHVSVTPAGTLHAAHVAATDDVPSAAATVTRTAAADPPASGHPGHESDADHSLSCKASSAAAMLVGALVAPDAAGPVTAGLPASVFPMRTAMFAVVQARPPDIATLCVQRI